MKQTAVGYPFPQFPRKWTDDERKFGQGLQYLIEQLAARNARMEKRIEQLEARVAQLENQP